MKNPKQGSIRFFVTKSHDEEYLYRSFGKLAGIDPRLFQSEVCSLLTAVCLLQLVVKYNNYLHNTAKEIKSHF